MQLDIDFTKMRVKASYFFLDNNLHANASGLAGVMFPFEKLCPLIDRVAKDIEANYESVLQGDAAVWQKIEKLTLAPRETRPFFP